MIAPARLRDVFVTAGRLLARPRFGFLLLVLVWGPLILWRAHLETSLWIDETYSLALVSHEPARVVALTATDLHPPGYYLVLKAWLELARIAGFEPGILWARLLGVGAWLGLALAGWLGGRRIAGERAGTLIAWMVAGSAYAALHARDVRSYSFASLGIFVAFLGWTLLLDRRGSGGRSGWRRGACLAIGFGSLLSLWSHLLSAVALAWLASVAVALLVRGERRAEGASPARRVPWLGILGTGAVVLIGFLPWLLRIREQIGFLESAAPTWMTPATWRNLASVFGFWLPFGRIGSPGPPENSLLLSVLGLVATLLPLGLALIAGFVARRSEPSPGPMEPAEPFGSIATLAVGSALLFVLTIWGLDRWDVADVFHGPRYPALVSALWAAGLATLAIWAVRRLERPLILAVGVLVPLLACSLIGQWTLAVRESSWGVLHWKESAPGLFPGPGEPIYVLPSELAPYYRRSLSEYDVRRIEELPCGALEAEEVTVVDVNPWTELARPRDRLARHFLTRPGIADSARRRSLPDGREDVRVTHLAGPSSESFRSLCPAGFVSRLARELSAAAAVGLPEEQGGAGWSWLEIGDDLLTGRWATREVAEVSFDRTLPAGDYLLHLVGERQPFPAAEARIRLEIPVAGWSHRETVAAGGFHLVAPIRFDHPLSSVVLEVEHPTWSPRQVVLSGDERTLSFLLRAAWFERR